MEKRKIITHVGFDVDSTFYRPGIPKFEEDLFREKLRAAYHLYGIGPTADVYVNHFDRLEQENYKEFRRMKSEIHAEALVHVSTRHLSEDHELKVAMNDLASKYKLFIVSNGPYSHVRSVLDAVRIDPKMFKFMFTSECVNKKKGIEKKSENNISAFEYTFKKMRLDPKKAVFVGDEKKIDMAVHELGTKTILCWRPKTVKSEIKNVDWEEARIYETPEVVEYIIDEIKEKDIERRNALKSQMWTYGKFK